MILPRLLLILASPALLASVTSASASAAEAGSNGMTVNAAPRQGNEWASYRDAYMQMIRFEKYGKPKNLIQQHYQVSPKSAEAALDGVVLTLSGSSTSLNLALDATGRAVFPFLKSAYDENARLVLNRPAGLYELRPRISIVSRQDGVYEVALLRAACEQAMNFLRYAGTSTVAECVGVRFSYAAGAGDPALRFINANGEQTTLPLEPGSAFPGEAAAGFRTWTLRFSEWSEKGRIVTHTMPAAVAPVFR